jgi:hypothetical protein
VLYYSADTTDKYASPTGGKSYSAVVDIPKNCTKIRAVTRCQFEYNLTEAAASAAVKYYAAPGNPGKPVLTNSSYRNGRLTIKQPWTFLWTPATASNSNSPVAGYRLRLYKNKTCIPIKNSAGTQLSSNSGNDYYYDTNSTSSSITIDPVIHGLNAGDIIYLTLFAYAKNGKGEKLFSGNSATAIASDEYTIQNAGVVNVKVNGSWKEGQVYVKVNGSWKEAETVNVKVNGAWQESQ